MVCAGFPPPAGRCKIVHVLNYVACCRNSRFQPLIQIKGGAICPGRRPPLARAGRARPYSSVEPILLTPEPRSPSHVSLNRRRSAPVTPWTSLSGRVFRAGASTMHTFQRGRCAFGISVCVARCGVSSDNSSCPGQPHSPGFGHGPTCDPTVRANLDRVVCSPCRLNAFRHIALPRDGGVECPKSKEQHFPLQITGAKACRCRRWATSGLP